MAIVNGQNLERVRLFQLKDYIAQIRLYESTLDFMEEMNQEFDTYMRALSQYKEKIVLHYWLSQNFIEIVQSNKIEEKDIKVDSHLISREEILVNDVFNKVVGKPLTHNTIDNLHLFVQQDKSLKKESYRKTENRVSCIDPFTEEEIIYWYGVQPEDVMAFMDDFLQIYNNKSISVIDSNPFLKSALIHLLFVRIHPYRDGNGRTARMLQNIKLTETINRLYGENFRLCPINLSFAILRNKGTYANTINNIYFGLEQDNTKYINKWFEFILNMIDEELRYRKTHLDNLEAVQYNYDAIKKEYDPEDKKGIFNALRKLNRKK